MTDEKIERLNALAKKFKSEGLTTEETEERAVLRREYLDAIKSSLRVQLDNTYILDEKGNKKKLGKK